MFSKVSSDQFSVYRLLDDEEGGRQQYRHYCDVKLNALIVSGSQNSNTWAIPDFFPSKKGSIASSVITVLQLTLAA